MIILFGPSWKSEILELPDDGAVTIVKRCPLLEHGHGAGCDGECTFHRCLALTLSTVPLLNKKYSARFVRTICTGTGSARSGSRLKKSRMLRNEMPL